MEILGQATDAGRSARGGHGLDWPVAMGCPAAQTIEQGAPQHPECFDTRRLWTDWLADAHATGLPVLKRIQIGPRSIGRKTWWVVRPIQQIDYCTDCTAQRQRQMQAQHKCRPSPACRPPLISITE